MNIVLISGQLHKHNGGTKLYNLLVKLLREHGYDAYIATRDGNYARWLVEHQPVISYKRVEELGDAKVVTGWLATEGLDAVTQGRRFYYFDAELKWTLEFRKTLDRYLATDMIAGIATHCRYIQAWYMANYGITPTLINEWSDTNIFYPDDEKRVEGRIGCMIDGEGAAAMYERLADEFPGHVMSILGDEQQVADAMRMVDIFVGLNPGKHPLWGEGYPTTQHEAMHSGCVLVAFDVLGNREYLYDGWTGALVRRGDRDGLVAAVRCLLSDKDEKGRLRQSGTALAKALFSDRGKIGIVRRFLDL